MKKTVTGNEIKKSVTDINETVKKRDQLREAGKVQKEWVDTLGDMLDEQGKERDARLEDGALKARVQETKIERGVAEKDKEIKGLQIKTRKMADDYNKIDKVKTRDDVLEYIGSPKKR